ncbi:hypothetical protein B5P40_25430 [Bacillus sp. SRB_8]|nr:hypothetical protein B5P40_25430 [Bacillus sp. SRB_8]
MKPIIVSVPLESIDSYKNAILSVYFYKKNSVFFVLWIQFFSLMDVASYPIYEFILIYLLELH